MNNFINKSKRSKNKFYKAGIMKINTNARFTATRSNAAYKNADTWRFFNASHFVFTSTRIFEAFSNRRNRNNSQLCISSRPKMNTRVLLLYGAYYII